MQKNRVVPIRLLVWIGCWLSLVSSAWSFPSDGIINDDFTYRNLQLDAHAGQTFISGLLTNRSDRAHLGVVLLFRADDCVTGRTKFKASLTIDNIDPQVEMPFKIPLPVENPGYVCRFHFRVGYNILPALSAPPIKTQADAQKTSLSSLQAAAGNPAVYYWVGDQGYIRYGSAPPESILLSRLNDGDSSASEPIYSWIDRNGITRYSDTPPDPHVLLEKYYYAMRSAPNIETYLTAMRRWIWGHWLHPAEAPTKELDFKARVGFNILSDGRIRDIRIEKSSGVDLLDESFYNAVAKSDPLPPLPKSVHVPAWEAEIQFIAAKVK